MIAPTRAESGAADIDAESGIAGEPAENGIAGVGTEKPGLIRTDSYAYYLLNVPGAARPAATIEAVPPDAGAAGPLSSGAYAGKENVTIWDNAAEYITWRISVAEAGLYEIALTYIIEESRQIDMELSLEINGEVPFAEATRLKLMREWRDDGAIWQDSRGNDRRPQLLPRAEWMTKPLRDYEGLYTRPYAFYFRAGENTVTLRKSTGKIAIGSLLLYNAGELPAYAEYSRGASATGAEAQIIPGTDYAYKSHSEIRTTYDRTSASTIPNDPVSVKINTVGQTGWNRNGQFVAWTVNVEKDGWYPIGIRFRQNVSSAVTSYRRLYINGEVPFSEADALPFRYSNGWQQQYLSGGDGEPYLFYLKAGDNELKLESMPGPVAEIRVELEQTLYTLNTLYRKIVMITGVVPDPYRDYQLEKTIPTIYEDFTRCEASLMDCKARLQALGNLRGLGNSSAILTTVAVQLSAFVKKPLTVAQRINTFRVNLSALADYLYILSDTPLEINYIVVGGGQDDGFMRVPIWKRAVFAVRSFFATFTTDYNIVGDPAEGGGGNITVWLNGDPTSGYGRDQAQILQDLINDMFTPSERIGVNLKLVQQSLIPAILSGSGPDAAIYVGGGDPVTIASRNGLADFDRFEGIGDVLGQFHPQSLIPYTYKGKLYGLPLTINFSMMFCRTDIMEELGIGPPATWDDFYDVLTILQRNNMTAGVPNLTPGSRVTNTSIFGTMLYQRGGSYYNGDFTATRFNEETAINVFEQWTGFFREYGLLKEYYFFQLFRSGEMPIGIEDYTMYNLLNVAAPELRHLWDMYPIPGHVGADGELNNTAISGGLTAVILEQSDKQEEAFKFLSWLTSADIQERYGRGIESLQGGGIRYNTANRAAFNNLPWSDREQKTIEASWDNITAIPVIPASYSLERDLTNAFRKVIISYTNPRETLNRYNSEINQEIRRKNLELS